MPRKSNKAEEIMDYVNQFIRENGYAPSVREIGAAVGLRSTASVSYHLNQMQEKGLLQAPAGKGKKRAVVTSVRPGQIPVIGVVTAGLPILAVEEVEDYVPFSGGSMYPAGELFALRVSGTSMINAGILDRDVVIVRRTNTAQNGDVVVALIGDEATVKRIYMESDHIRLQPENPEFEPIIVKEAIVLGKVISLVRYF